MLEILNRYQQLDLVDLKVNDDSSLCLVLAQAYTPVESAATVHTSKADHQTQDLMTEILHSERTAEVTGNSAIYEVLFEEFIIYSVTVEGFLSPLDAHIKHEPFGVFESSAFSAYVKATTDSEFPEPFKHYVFDCVNYRVDIASTLEPKMNQVQ